MHEPRNVRKSHLMPTADERETMDSIVALLQKFKVATIMISSEKKTTISLILPIIDVFNNHLTIGMDDKPTVKKVKKAIKDDLDTRYQGDEIRNILKIATFLDPRFKELEWISIDIQNLVRDKTLDIVVKVFNDNNDTSIPVSSATVLKENEPANFFVSILKKSKPNTPNVTNNDMKSQIELEIKRYIQEPGIDNPTQFNPIDWWKHRASCYPNLAETVKNLFCVPATSVPSERVFSTAGNIVNKLRSSLNPKNVDMLLFLNKNRHLNN